MSGFKSFFKGNDGSNNSKILSELGSNVRIFTVEEISEVTENYAHRLGGGTYKGTLEDNARVVVRKLLYRDSKEAFLNGGVTLSQIVHHQNIVRLLGCCLEAETPVFVYEYVPRGSLFDVLGGHEDLPLDLRLRIAIKIAEALEFLHSSATGVMGHGGVTASNILLDGNFVPKLAGFSLASKLITKESEEAAVGSSSLEKILWDDPARYGSVLMNMESDVYRFGGILLALISRDTDDTDHRDLIAKFTTAYEEERSGGALFDRSITAEEDIRVLDEIGRLALKCTILKVDEMPKRPTMKELAEELRVLQRSCQTSRLYR